jgi:hypothetical protein
MTGAFCPNPIKWDLNKDNGKVQFVVEATWDGASTPTTGIGCDGVVSRVTWNNTGQRTWYAHLPQAHVAGVSRPAVYQIVPGGTGNVTNRTVLHAAGLDSRADIIGPEGLDLNEIPPQPGETLINP